MAKRAIPGSINFKIIPQQANKEDHNDIGRGRGGTEETRNEIWNGMTEVLKRLFI
jgi:hypothetical protein